ncbi:MAG TPA: copper chaperone PCu(A)C [Candidatus Binatia bacterium]|nr:copper chaperone PCu(A)C [Candidatus Binatia bacterium]
MSRSSTLRWGVDASILAVGVALAVFLAACGTAASPSTAVVISDAWVRATPTIDEPAAGYLTIANGGSSADALLTVSSPIGMVGIHKSELDSSGMEWMHPVDRVDVPAGATVSLAPGSYHLMITGFTAPIAVGQQIELDLVFEHAGRIVVQATVKAG